MYFPNKIDFDNLYKMARHRGIPIRKLSDETGVSRSTIDGLKRPGAIRGKYYAVVAILNYLLDYIPLEEFESCLEYDHEYSDQKKPDDII